MWFRVDHKRQSRAQKFIVRCMAEMAGSRVAEEREVKGTTAARKTAEILASSLNVTATVYGTDADGEFVYGVFEVAESAAGATSAVIKKLFAESAAASLTFKDQLLADIPEKPSKASRPCRDGQGGKSAFHCRRPIRGACSGPDGLWYFSGFEISRYSEYGGAWRGFGLPVTGGAFAYAAYAWSVRDDFGGAAGGGCYEESAEVAWSDAAY